MQLCLEQLQNPLTSDTMAEKHKLRMERCIYQSDIMFSIISKNTSLMTEIRIGIKI